ncbi:hypothetical protein C8R42DRAFT_720688 [Lentinula raphanica]|nr:hypothetical protein C8R42DRAFT_720688 [Lentinula raphanica]
MSFKESLLSNEPVKQRPIALDYLPMRFRANLVFYFLFLLVPIVFGMPVPGRTLDNLKSALKSSPRFSYTSASHLKGIETKKSPAQDASDQLAKELIQSLFRLGISVNVRVSTQQYFNGSWMEITSPRESTTLSGPDSLSPDQFVFQFDVEKKGILKKPGTGLFGRGGARANIVVKGGQPVIDQDSIEGVLQTTDGRNMFEVRGGKATITLDSPKSAFKSSPRFSYTFAAGTETKKSPVQDATDQLAKELIQSLFRLGISVNVRVSTQQYFNGSSTDITSPRKSTTLSGPDKMSPDQFVLQFDVDKKGTLKKPGTGLFGRGGARADIVVKGGQPVIDQDSIEGVLQTADGRNMFEVRGGKATITLDNLKPAFKSSPRFSYTFAAQLKGIETKKSPVHNPTDQLAKELIQSLFKIGISANVRVDSTQQNFVGSSTDITSPRKSTTLSRPDKMSPDQFVLQFDVDKKGTLKKPGTGLFGRGGARADIVVKGGQPVIDQDSIEGVLQTADGRNMFEIRGGKATITLDKPKSAFKSSPCFSYTFAAHLEGIGTKRRPEQ